MDSVVVDNNDEHFLKAATAAINDSKILFFEDLSVQIHGYDFNEYDLKVIDRLDRLLHLNILNNTNPENELAALQYFWEEANEDQKDELGNLLPNDRTACAYEKYNI